MASSSSSISSGTLGNAAPVSFPGISSGIDYNSIIQKYTADTLAQNKPTQNQINNLSKQNVAILKIQSLIGGVQDTLTALSDPAVFGAFKAAVSTTANGSPAATTSQIKNQSPIAGTYTINAQKVATATSIVNDVAANGTVNLNGVPADQSGTAVAISNGTASNGKFTINGVSINYNASTQTLGSIISSINSALQAQDGGSATYNAATGKVTLTGVTSIGSGADSGNLATVLKLDTAALGAGTLDPTLPLSGETLTTAPTGTTVVNGATALNADDLKTAVTGGQIVINGTSVAFAATDSINTVIANINAAAIPGVTASLSGNKVTLTGVTSLADAGGGNLTSVLNLAGTGSVTSSSSVIYTADVTVNGTQVGYDPTTDSLNTILTRITTNTGVAASVSGNLVTLGGTLTSLTDGPGGNLLEALNLPTGPGPSTSTSSIYNASTQTITSSSSISGLNSTSVLNQNNNAGFATAVTSGTFTINGVSFTVDATKDSLSNVITRINGSTAGVTATYNSQTSQILLTAKTPGAQAILLGASGDSSNFLSASGLNTAGRTLQTGTQASLTYTDTLGSHTVYSATNDFTSAVPGIDININTSSPASLPVGSVFYTITVAADPTKAEAAIGTFVKAYNKAIQELNQDTVAPTVKAGADASNGVSSATSSGGGVLYGNFQVSSLRDRLVNLVSGFIPSGSTSYNSLASVGLKLDTSSQAVGTQSADSDDTSDTDNTNSANNSFTVNATSGQLAALDTTAFEAAYAANTSAVQGLFTLQPRLQPAVGSSGGTVPVTGATYGFSYLIGQQLAQIDGLSTFLTGSLVSPGNLATSLLNSITSSNNQQIDSLQSQIALINREATQQADALRQQFSASETQIAKLQALQAQIAKIGN